MKGGSIVRILGRAEWPMGKGTGVSEMKAISLRQPWASMIASGRKTTETRTWYTDYRGDVLICASKRPMVDDLLTGQALCIATIVDCRPMTVGDEKTACCEWYPSAFAWVLENIRPIEPFPVKGKLGFYEVEYPKGI